MEGSADNVPTKVDDSFSWLEDRTGVQATDWVRKHNAETEKSLTADPRFAEYHRSALAVINDGGGLNRGFATFSVRDNWVYRVLQNDAHSRGLWQRTLLDSFCDSNPKWESLLDLDALARNEGKRWSLQRAIFSPNGRRVMLELNEGSYETAFREFDLEKREFVPHGFEAPLAKGGSLVWNNEDSVYVATDFGPGSSTSTGYTRIAKAWTRGTPLSAAKEIFAGDRERHRNISVEDLTDGDGSALHILYVVSNDGRNSFEVKIISQNGDLTRMSLPDHCDVMGYHRKQVVFSCDQDWTVGQKTWPAGSILSISREEITRPDPKVHLVMEAPGLRELHIRNVQRTTTALVVFGYQNMRPFARRVRFERDSWTQTPLQLPADGKVEPRLVMYLHDKPATHAYFSHESILAPPTLYELDVQRDHIVPLKTSSQQFDSDNFVTEQLEALSADRTAIPYFLVRPRSLKFDGTAPTLMYGYGAYGGPQFPTYDGVLGRLWLERGGVYVLANIRGGSEFGETWHVRGIERQHTYDDFKAIAQDLIRRNITTPKRLGIVGYSAGGLLMGVMVTQYPHLFGAALIELPMLDLFRLDLVGSGTPAIHAHEYGSASVPEERAFLERTSPFQNLRKYDYFPSPFILSNAMDEYVYPAQPRRFAAKMESLDLPFYYYEISEGDHSLGTLPEEQAQVQAMIYVYLAKRLMDTSKPAIQ